MARLLFCFIICLTATTVGAISGVGGGVVIKPMLDAVSGMAVDQISFLSTCTVLCMTTVSLLTAKSGGIALDLPKTTPLAIGAALGGILGKQLFDTVKKCYGAGLVGTCQSLVMILIMATLLIYTTKRNAVQARHIRNPVSCLLIGISLGVVSSFLGIGGGPMNLTVLHYCFSMDTKTAALNSLYIIFFSQLASLGKTFISRAVPDYELAVLMVMASGGILGGFGGRKIAKRISARRADTVYRAFLCVIMAVSFHNLISFWTME